MKLYCDGDVIESLIALIALNERQKDFKILSSVDDIKLALHLSPDGKLPLLVEADKRVSGCQPILKYLGFDNDIELEHINQALAILPDVNKIMYGTCKNAQQLVSHIRWPYNEANSRDKIIQDRLDLLTIHLSGGKSKEKKELDFALDAKNLPSLVARVDQFLESVQLRFLKDDEKKIGLWLTGIQFSTLDCLLTGILLRLYQLGWDETLWSQGEKADITMYANQAFQRPSALQASQWKEHQMEISIFDQEPSDVKHARYASYAALAFASVYIVKKVFFKK